MPYETLHDLLERARAEQDMTKREAASALDVTPQTYYNWLRGQRPTELEHLDAIAKFTGDDFETVLVAAGYARQDDDGTLVSPIPGLLSSESDGRRFRPDSLIAAA